MHVSKHVSDETLIDIGFKENKVAVDYSLRTHVKNSTSTYIFSVVNPFFLIL